MSSASATDPSIRYAIANRYGRSSSCVSMPRRRDSSHGRDSVGLTVCHIRAKSSVYEVTRKEDEMKVLVIGATGAVGLPLMSQLVERGHAVVGTSRTQERAETLRRLGAEPAVLDLLDREAVRRLVLETKPDAIVHQATALADGIDFKRFAETFAPTNRLRTEGTDNLLSAAMEAGIEKLVAQSYGGGPDARGGGAGETEDDPPDQRLPGAGEETGEGIKHLETAVVAAGG